MDSLDNFGCLNITERCNSDSNSLNFEERTHARCLWENQTWYNPTGMAVIIGITINGTSQQERFIKKKKTTQMKHVRMYKPNDTGSGNHYFDCYLDIHVVVFLTLFPSPFPSHYFVFGLPNQGSSNRVSLVLLFQGYVWIKQLFLANVNVRLEREMEGKNQVISTKHFAHISTFHSLESQSL